MLVNVTKAVKLTVVLAIGLLLAKDGHGQDCIQSCVRLKTGYAVGSGVVIESDGEEYRVLTNAHVAGKVGTKISVEFNRDGYPFTTTGIVRRSELLDSKLYDLAIVEVPKSSVPLTVPVIACAKSDPEKWDSVITCGAQGGEPVSLQMGFIEKLENSAIFYKPRALPGRSGSPLFNSEHELVGLVGWHDQTKTFGIAMPISVIQRFLNGDARSAPIPTGATRCGSQLVLVSQMHCPPCDKLKESLTALGASFIEVFVEHAGNDHYGWKVRTTPTLLVIENDRAIAVMTGYGGSESTAAFLRRWRPQSQTDQLRNDTVDSPKNPWTKKRASPDLKAVLPTMRERVSSRLYARLVIVLVLLFVMGGFVFVVVRFIK